MNVAYYIYLQVLQLDEFKAFVVEDARSVHQREETDTISIIDDIRFHITNSVQTFSDMYDAEDKLTQIDHLLDTLQLDAWTLYVI